jgi:hypothetical protein
MARISDCSRYPIVAIALVGTAALGLISAFIKGRGLFSWFNEKSAEPKATTEKKKR